MIVSTAERHADSHSWKSRRLWSLWEMQRFDANAVVYFAKEMKRLSMTLDTADGATVFRTPEQKENDIMVVSAYRSILGDVGLTNSCAQIERIIERCAPDKHINNKQMAALVEQLADRMEDECNSKLFLSLSSKETQYFSPAEQLFGDDFSNKFPSEGVFELDEAGKCFGLGRHTAAVFHLMRLMEIGIKAAGKCLGVPDPVKAADRNWGNMLSSLKSDMDSRGGQKPTKTWAVAGDKPLFEGVYVSLDAVRVAWRNTTMHVDQKYTEEEAEHVFIAVKRLFENGLNLSPARDSSCECGTQQHGPDWWPSRRRRSGIQVI